MVFAAALCPLQYIQYAAKEERVDFEKSKEELEKMRGQYPEEVLLKRAGKEFKFKTQFLCKFVLLRKEFFKKFIERLDPQDFPKEIDMDGI